MTDLIIQAPKNEDRIVNAKEIAHKLGISCTQAYRLIKRTQVHYNKPKQTKVTEAQLFTANNLNA